jgi:hypothetical protein
MSNIKEILRISRHINNSLDEISDEKMREMILSFVFSGDDRIIMTKYYSHYPEFKPVDWVDIWK